MSTIVTDAVTALSGNLALLPEGSGVVTIDGLTYPAADGSANQLMKTNGSGVLGFTDAPTGGAWTLIGTEEADNDASLTITGIDSTYDTYGVAVSGLVPATNNVDFYIRFGDSSGIDSGSTDYAYHASGGRAGAATARTAISGTGAAQIALKLTGDGILNSNGGGFGMMAHILNPSDTTTNTAISGTYQYIASQYEGDGGSFGANRRAIIAHDRIQVLFSSGNITTGRLTVWGLAHA